MCKYIGEMYWGTKHRGIYMLGFCCRVSLRPGMLLSGILKGYEQNNFEQTFVQYIQYGGGRWDTFSFYFLTQIGSKQRTLLLEISNI